MVDRFQQLSLVIFEKELCIPDDSDNVLQSETVDCVFHQHMRVAKKFVG